MEKTTLSSSLCASSSASAWSISAISRPSRDCARPSSPPAILKNTFSIVARAKRERRRPPWVDARELERRNVRVRGGDVDVRRRKGLARERHEVRDVRVVPRLQAARDLIARRVALLELLRRPDAAHGALDHDADAVAEEIG